MINKILILLIFLTLGTVSVSYAQEVPSDTTKNPSYQLYVIIKNDGTEYVGQILSQDAREVLLKTKELGELYIPKHEIKEIKAITDPKAIRGGVYIGEDPFSTRYFINTNALPMHKGELYALFNWYGPEVHYGATDKFNIGIMTSWFGMPFIATAKYAFSDSREKGFHASAGVLAGFGSWAAPEYAGALPFLSITGGDGANNISLSGGYAIISVGSGQTEGAGVFGLSGLARLGKRTSFVFDSMFGFPQDPDINLIGIAVPGLRFQRKRDSAFQFGFAAAFSDTDLIPVPLPFAGWFVKF